MLLTAQDVWSQASVEPGRVQKQFEPPTVPHATPDIVVPDIPSAIAPAEASKVRVVLTAIVIDGASVYTTDHFEPLSKPLIGHEIALSEIFALADAITTRYRHDDYILSRAVVPAQRLEKGVLHIQVVEGFINKVHFEGPVNDLLEQYGQRIVAEHPLRGAVLERYLLLMNDLPGLSARAVLAPATGSVGGSDLTLVTAQKKVDAYAGFDNHGTRYIGPLEISSGVNANNALGLGEKTSLNYATSRYTKQLKYVNIGEEMPFGSDGLLVTFHVGRSISKPGFLLSELEADATGDMLGAKISYPLQRSRADTLKVHAGFDFLNSATVMNGAPDISPSSNDHIRALRLGVTYDRADTFHGHNLFEMEVSRGLNMWGASRDDNATLSRPNGRSDFEKLTLEASRRQELSQWVPNLGLYLAASAQSSLGDNLLSSEQFGVGGSTFGRGYDPSEITGDSGLSAKAELQYSVNRDGVIDATQFYAFYDFGSTRNRQPDNKGAHEYSLASTGAGVRFDILNALSGDLVAAQPLTRLVAAEKLAGKENRPLAILFSLTARY